MLKVTKTVRFDAAHVLTNHPGQCRNLHGHSYRVDVSVAQAEGATGDMVVDFKDLKKVCEDVVVAGFDHSFIYDRTSPLEREIAALLERNGMRTSPLPFRSTAENIARTVFDALAPRMPGLCSVQVWETPDSVAEYSR